MGRLIFRIISVPHSPLNVFTTYSPSSVRSMSRSPSPMSLTEQDIVSGILNGTASLVQSLAQSGLTLASLVPATNYGQLDRVVLLKETHLSEARSAFQEDMLSDDFNLAHVAANLNKHIEDSTFSPDQKLEIQLCFMMVVVDCAVDPDLLSGLQALTPRFFEKWISDPEIETLVRASKQSAATFVVPLPATVVKVFKVNNLDWLSQFDVFREVRFLNDHGIDGLARSTGRKATFVQGDDRFIAVEMPNYGPDVLHLVNADADGHKKTAAEIAKSWIAKVTTAFEGIEPRLKQNGLVMGDIRAENIFGTSAVFGDFGLARVQGDRYFELRHQRMVGGGTFAHPRSFSGHAFTGFDVDRWNALRTTAMQILSIFPEFDFNRARLDREIERNPRNPYAAIVRDERTLISNLT